MSDMNDLDAKFNRLANKLGWLKDGENLDETIQRIASKSRGKLSKSHKPVSEKENQTGRKYKEKVRSHAPIEGSSPLQAKQVSSIRVTGNKRSKDGGDAAKKRKQQLLHVLDFSSEEEDDVDLSKLRVVDSEPSVLVDATPDDPLSDSMPSSVGSVSIIPPSDEETSRLGNITNDARAISCGDPQQSRPIDHGASTCDSLRLHFSVQSTASMSYSVNNFTAPAAAHVTTDSYSIAYPSKETRPGSVRGPAGIGYRQTPSSPCTESPKHAMKCLPENRVTPQKGAHNSVCRTPVRSDNLNPVCDSPKRSSGFAVKKTPGPNCHATPTHGDKHTPSRQCPISPIASPLRHKNISNSPATLHSVQRTDSPKKTPVASKTIPTERTPVSNARVTPRVPESAYSVTCPRTPGSVNKLHRHTPQRKPSTPHARTGNTITTPRAVTPRVKTSDDTNIQSPRSIRKQDVIRTPSSPKTAPAPKTATPQSNLMSPHVHIRQSGKKGGEGSGRKTNTPGSGKWIHSCGHDASPKLHRKGSETVKGSGVCGGGATASPGNRMLKNNIPSSPHHDQNIHHLKTRQNCGDELPINQAKLPKSAGKRLESKNVKKPKTVVKKKDKKQNGVRAKFKYRLKAAVEFSSDSDASDGEARPKVTKELLHSMRDMLNRTGYTNNTSSSSAAETTHHSTISSDLSTRESVRDESEYGNRLCIDTSGDDAASRSPGLSGIFVPCSLPSQEDAQRLSPSQSPSATVPDGIKVIPCSQDSPEKSIDSSQSPESVESLQMPPHHGKLSVKKPPSKLDMSAKKSNLLKQLDLFSTDEDSPVPTKSRTNHDRIDGKANIYCDTSSSLSETQSSQVSVSDIDILSQRLEKILGSRKQKKKTRKPAGNSSKKVGGDADPASGNLHVLNEKLHKILTPSKKVKHINKEVREALGDSLFSSDATPDSSRPSSPGVSHDAVGKSPLVTHKNTGSFNEPRNVGDLKDCREISLQVSLTEDDDTPNSSHSLSPKRVSMSLQVSMAPSSYQFTSDESSRDCSPAAKTVGPVPEISGSCSEHASNDSSVINGNDSSMLSTDSTPDAYKSAINQTVFVTPPQTVAAEFRTDLASRLGELSLIGSGPPGIGSYQDISAEGNSYNSSLEVCNTTRNLNSVLEKCISPSIRSHKNHSEQTDRSVELRTSVTPDRSSIDATSPQTCDQSLQVSVMMSENESEAAMTSGNESEESDHVSRLSFDSNLDASVCEGVKSPIVHQFLEAEAEESSSPSFTVSEVSSEVHERDTSETAASAPRSKRYQDESSDEEDLENFFSKMRAPQSEQKNHYMSLHDFIVDSSSEEGEEEEDDEDAHRRTDQALQSQELSRLDSYRPSDAESLPTIEAPTRKRNAKNMPGYTDSLSEDEESSDDGLDNDNDEEEGEELPPCTSSEDEDEVEEAIAFKTPARRHRVMSIEDDDDDDDVFKTPAFKPRTPANRGTTNTAAPFQTPLERQLGASTLGLPRHLVDGPLSERSGVRTPGRMRTSVLHDITGPARPNSTGHLSQFQPFLKSLGSDVPDCAKHPEAIKYVKNFKKHREELTKKLYDLYNETVFDNKLPSDMLVKWNSHLLKTAGYCAYKRFGGANIETRRTARIELSVKVCDSAERVRDTLIHEMCHAGVWLIHGTNGGHGHLWKAYACRAMKVHRDLPSIARCHTYEINYKFTYQCTKCSYKLGRHSKSLDTNRKVCGYCHSPFELLVNTGSRQALSAAGVPKTPRTPGPFALFVKENYGSVKRQTPGIPHKDVMKHLGAEFQRLKTQ